MHYDLLYMCFSIMHACILHVCNLAPPTVVIHYILHLSMPMPHTTILHNYSVLIFSRNNFLLMKLRHIFTQGTLQKIEENKITDDVHKKNTCMQHCDQDPNTRYAALYVAFFNG